MSGIIPPDHAIPPQDAPGSGTGKRHVPDARRATGDPRLGAMLKAMRRADGRGRVGRGLLYPRPARTERKRGEG